MLINVCSAILFCSILVTAYPFISPIARLRLSSKSKHFVVSTEKETEVIVIGSGIGGLCAAALLSASGVKVKVLESHYEIGLSNCLDVYGSIHVLVFASISYYLLGFGRVSSQRQH